MANTLEDLREHLFGALKALRDTEKPMPIDRAKAISEIAQTVINTAKVEVDYVRAIGRREIALPVFGAIEAPKEPAPALPPGVVGVTTHKMKG